MMRAHRATLCLILGVGAAFVLSACSSDSSGKMTSTTDSGSTSTDDTGTHPTSTGTAQQPAMSAAMVATWLAKGDYKSWACEPAVHEARSPSPHGFNRICSNDVLSAAAGSTEPFPEGAAAVKELYASVTGTTPVGYAVYSKTKADSEGGAAWYWYEIIPTDSMAAPHDKTGLVADGLGDGGPAKMICVGCHAAAGSDAAHTPTVGGHDQVYTPVSASSNIDGG